ncbi:RHS repeat domain-containing protein [Steroidobacter cummioxidans]|uniref:RHS repeat domain-containing protein n=1 Tax=Steroidobacter cummioxidans TaxID=1803913 RepID=UPI00137AF31F|nr:RHS repeat protein [Steroidobacter cummioxidans]
MRGLQYFLTSIGLGWLLAVSSAWAITPQEIFGKPENSFSSINVGQFEGEYLDVRTLTLSWETKELIVPGNGGLDIVVSRSFGKSPVYGPMGNWELEVPRIHIQTTPHITTRGPQCEQPGPPDTIELFDQPPPGQPTVSTPGSFYSGPMVLLMPGERARLLVRKLDSATQYPTDVKYVTADNWIVRCVNSGAGFEVSSPSGTRYLMQQWTHLKFGDQRYGTFPGYQVFGATTVTDVHGNSLTYAYEPSGIQYQNRLASITANDGRAVTFNYYPQSTAPSSRKLQSFTFNGRSWNFYYVACSSGSGRFAWQGNCLERVVQPEGLQWSYLNTSDGALIYNGPGMTRVTAPSGASVNYTYHKPVPDRGNVVHTRSVTGATIPTSSWTYTKSINTDYEFVTITGPTRREAYTFHRGWHNVFNDNYLYQPPRNPLLPGLLSSLVISSIDASVAYRTITPVYADLPAIGQSILGAYALPNQVKPVPMQSQTIAELAPGLSYVTTWSNFDSFGLARTMVENGNATRQTNYTYFSSSSPWIANVVDSEEVVGEGIIDRTFFGNGKLQSLNKYGIVESYDYHSDGSLHHRYWMKDGVQLSQTYTNYYRGTARREEHPSGVVYEREVNPDGTVQWSKDPLSNTTYYEYDGLKRPTKLTPPLGGITNIAWPTPTRMVLTRGNYEKTVSTDALWRVTEIKERDLTKPVNEITYVRSLYDPAGRLSFKSIPSLSAGELRGLSYEYDVLDRKTKETNTSDGSYAWICYHCVKGGKTTQYNENAELISFEVPGELPHHAYRYYRSYGNPDEKALMSIRQSSRLASNKFEASEYIHTQLGRDRLGNLTSVQQGSVLREYVYYPTKLVWKIIEPETGTTEFSYDEQGNLKTSKVASSGATTYTYDALNRLTDIDYPGATPDVNKGYYADGKLRWVTNSSGRWDYTYDAARRLGTEILTTNGRTFGLGYEYDGNDALAKITYPSGTEILTHPDALGRATSVGAYANSLGYHPNGELKAMTYGNGQQLTFTLDNRNYPDSIVVARGAVQRVSMGLVYNTRGDLTTIVDHRDARNSRELRYDGVHRLIGADGPWGTGTLVYDAADNITSIALGAAAKSLHYDETTNRLSSVTGAVNYTLQYDVYGNITNNGLYSYTFNDASQLVSVPSVVGLNYQYDGNGKRIRSSASGGDTYYLYNQAGLLMYQTNATAAQSSEFFYAGNKLVARRDFGDGVNPDIDGDGLPNHIELQIGSSMTDPNDALLDFDGDGLSNLAEYLAGTELTSADTDGDGMSDGYEVRFGLNPFVNDAHLDPDGDGLTNLQESQLGTNPNKADTDNDGIPDGLDPHPRFNPALIPIIEMLLND